MRTRSSHLRTKVVALLVSLIALWGFAAYVTMRDGVNLLWVARLDSGVGRPTESLVAALQQERRLSVVYLAGNTAAQRAALSDQRTRTDEAAATFRARVHESSVSWAASTVLARHIADETNQLDGLGRTRASIDSGGVDRATAAAFFTSLVDTGFLIYGSLSTLDDDEIAQEGRTLVKLSRAQELLSQEDALLAGVLTAGRFSGSEPDQIAQLVGVQRFQHAEAAAELPPADNARYRDLTTGEEFQRFRATEDRVLKAARTGGPPPVDAESWRSVVDPVFAGLRDLILVAADHTVARATPSAAWVVVRLALAGGLGLLAVIASIIMSITTARAIVRQLAQLRDAAWNLATERLPRVVERLRNGEDVDVAAEAPPLTFGSDEIGQVGQAFNAVQQTAIGAAVDQAELRKSVRDVFLSLARRTQALVHRQLSLLDQMERHESDAAELAALFRLDHLATRMRRNAENLIVLSGAAPGRGWRQAVRMVDVVRGSVAEVEEYTRVTVLPMASAQLAGRAVGDVIHLLAELIENAVSFSPPYTSVQVGGQQVANGYVFEIEDRGMGLSEELLAEANEKLANPPQFKLSGTARLGLYVVARLAHRHGIKVNLRSSAYGGTMAVILIPRDLVVDEEPAQPPGSVDDLSEPAPVEATALAAIGSGHAFGNGRSEARRVRTVVPAAEVSEAPTAPAPAGGAPAPATQPPDETAHGLPRRVRQASFTAQQRQAGDDASAVEAPAGGPRPRVPRPNSSRTERSPEEIRLMMGSFHAASVRGRAEAERTMQPGQHAAAAMPDEPASEPPPAPPDSAQW